MTTSTANQVTLAATEKLSNTGFDSNNTSWSVAAVPPSGWVEVPGNATYSTTNFLAMKYEAKCAATSDPTTGLTSPTTGSNTYANNTTNCTAANSRQVVSVASGYPIAIISQTNSITYCSGVTIGSTSAHLQTNNEWMTTARNAEAQAGNWYGGVVGTNFMFSGHNDNGPASALAASADDTLGYTGTNDSTSSCDGIYNYFVLSDDTTSGRACVGQKRTLALSNSSTLWDIPGNVWEWTNDVQGTAIDTTAGWVEWNHANIATGALALYGSSSASYLSAQSMGQVYGGALNNGILRGGHWSVGANAGAFTLTLYYTPSGAYASIGFRCASDPVAISQSFSSTSGRSSAGGNTVTIGSVSDGKVYQSVNVGDTSTYNISAYVYNNTAGSVGGSVDTNVAQLYYGGNTIGSAAWTAVSGETGWYKLTGTVTGVASSTQAGVLVKAGKTVKVDDISLSNYATSGTLTSSVFDSGQESNWGPVSSTATTPTNTSASVTAAFSDDSSNMGTFGACTTSSCATNKRYAQYKITLSNTDYVSTPTFTNFSLSYSAYDSTPPSISLNSVSSPTSSTKPAVSGTATEDVGTVSTVEYQMDATSGTWTACTATDGSLNSASEAFSCTPSSALSDGSHTMYVRSTDSNGNTTSNANASTKTFTVDATAPASFDLDSPSNDSYTSSERPTFKWKATTDATSGLSSYTLEIDNGASGDFTISGIPTSRTTDYETTKYLIHYDGFSDSDSDSTNDYISVYTKSSSSWGTGENDGKLKEGSRTWTIKAIDNVGNERSQSRVVIVDFTSPALSSLSTIYLKIVTSRQAQELLQGKVSKEEKKTIQEKSQVSLPALEEKAKERRQREAEELEKAISPIAEQFKSQLANLKMAVDGAKVFLAGLASELAVRIQDSSNVLLLAVSRAMPGIANTASLVLVKPWQELSAVLDNSSLNIQKAIVRTYRSKPPVEGADQILRPLADLGLAVRETVGEITARVVLGGWAGVKGTNSALTQASDHLQRQIAKNNLEKFKFVRQGVSNLAFGIGEKAQNISDRAGFEIVQFGYLFVNEPTKISDVEVATLSPTSVKITWKTNHPANGKVNYGLDETYPFDVQTSKRTTYHEFTLTDLQPNTEYRFEVMSQNKNYVYDANREFKTPGK